MEIVLQQVTAKGFNTSADVNLPSACIPYPSHCVPAFIHHTQCMWSQHQDIRKQTPSPQVTIQTRSGFYLPKRESSRGHHSCTARQTRCRSSIFNHEMARCLGGTDHWTFTGRGTLISYYKKQMRHTGCFNILWATVRVKSEGAWITRSSRTKSTKWSLTISIWCGDSGFLGCEFILTFKNRASYI
jgi:hypothetical protein